MRGFKIAHGQLAARLRNAFDRITALEQTRAAAPARIPVREAVETDVVKLAPERKLLTNLLKMVPTKRRVVCCIVSPRTTNAP